MSDDLKELMRSACEAYEAVGVQGENGARAMREGLDRIEELESERDHYINKLMEADNTYTEMHLRIEELEAKLAKAVEVMEAAHQEINHACYESAFLILKTALAELKGQDVDMGA